jgi:hypothetical protein
MAVTLSTATRNAACKAIVDLIDAGTGAGTLEIQDSGNTEIATLTFSDPAFGDPATGTATADTITSDTDATGGDDAALFQIKDGDGTVVLSGSVGTSGADINLNTLTIGAGATVSITSLTVTVPAS